MKRVTWRPGLKLPWDPDAVDDFSWDWSDWLGEETLSQATVEHTGEGMTTEVRSTSDTAVVVRVSKGTAGEEHHVKVRATSNTGRVQDRTVIYVCSER